MAINQLLHIFVTIMATFAFGKVTYYHLKLRTAKKMKQHYEAYLRAISANEHDWNAFDRLNEFQPEAIRLFEQAGLGPTPVPFVKPVGFTHIQSGHVTAWNNLTNATSDIVGANRKSFGLAIGFFRARRNETAEPVYWIELVLLHPRKILEYLGFAHGWLLNVSNLVALIAEIAAVYKGFFE